MFRQSPPNPESTELTDELNRLFVEGELDQAAFDRIVERARRLRDPIEAYDVLRYFAVTEALVLPADLAAPVVTRRAPTPR